MMETVSQTTGRIRRFVDIVFPGETNHHGTLFGGIGLAHMDRVALIAAARHARIPGQLLRGRWYARQRDLASARRARDDQVPLPEDQIARAVLGGDQAREWPSIAAALELEGLPNRPPNRSSILAGRAGIS